MIARRRPALAASALVFALVACSPGEGGSSNPTPNATVTGGTSGSSPPGRPLESPSGPPAAAPSSTPSALPTPGRTPPARATTVTPAPALVSFDPDAALADIRRLATDIGPREATSAKFKQAADLVDQRFSRLGYEVRRKTVRVPAGNSWGTPVRRGTSQNVIAEPPGFDPRRPHLVVGAHLDTVPVAPGAEDNASGISVLLELARMAKAERTRLPVQLIAFGAEEPRGSGDALHHFGSQQHVADLSRAEREAIVAMVSLDRVGVRASYVPVCRSPIGGRNLRDDLRAAARRVDVSTRACELTTSDHWSYAKAGVPAARLGSVDYDEYHSRRDTFRVVDRRQLNRVGRLMWSWLTGR